MSDCESSVVHDAYCWCNIEDNEFYNELRVVQCETSRNTLFHAPESVLNMTGEHIATNSTAVVTQNIKLVVPKLFPVIILRLIPHRYINQSPERT